MRCRGRAGCRPGQTEHGERGKRPERAEPLVARQGPMPAAALGAWPSLRSSPRAGKPSTWRRRTAGLQHRKPFSWPWPCRPPAGGQEVGCEYVRALLGERRGAGTGMAEEAAPLGDQRTPCGEPGAGELARRVWRAEAGRPPRVSEVWRPASDPSRRDRLVADAVVLFWIELGSRRVRLAGVTANPDCSWVTQQARNLAVEEELDNVRFLIHDRDTKFSGPFDEIVRGEGVRVIKTPVRAPRANAVAERWVRSVRTECLDH